MNKPSSDSYVLDAIISGDGSIAYHLTIDDVVDSIDETTNEYYSMVYGPAQFRYSIGSTWDQYVAMVAANPSTWESLDTLDWDVGGYAVAFDQQNYANLTTPFSSVVLDTSLTYEEWLLSRATVKLTTRLVADHVGRYVGNKSLISEPAAVLQDNFFYQIYSYVIESEIDEQQYKQALPLIHPAGLKRFGEISKITNFDLGSDLTVSQSGP
jgi:hypothetical protein